VGDGISWQIDLDAKTGGAADTILALDRMNARVEAVDQAVDRLLGRMEKLTDRMGNDAGWSKAAANLQNLSRGTSLSAREMRDVQTACDRANREIERMGDSTATVEPLWRSVFKGELAMEALRKAAHLTFEAIRWGAGEAMRALGVAASAERVQSVFANILGPEEGKTTLDYLEKVGRMGEFTKAQLVDMSSGLLQAGLRGADFRNAIGAAADVAATSTNKIEGYAGAVAALERIYRTGRIEGRALGGLHLKSAEVESQVSKDTGLDRKTVKKRLEEGTLDAREAMASIYTVMEAKSGEHLGQLGINMANGVQSKLEKIRELPEEIFRSLVNSPGYKLFGDSLDGIADKFGPDSPAGRALRDGLGDLLGFIGKEIKDMDWNEVASGIRDVVELTKTFFGLVEKGAKLVGWVLHPFAEATRQWGDWGEQAGRWTLKRREEQNAKDVAEAFGDEPAAAETVAASDAAGQAAGDALVRGTRDAVGAHSPSEKFRDIGADCAAGFALGFAAPPPVSPPSIGALPPVANGRGGLSVGDLHLSLTVQVSGSSATPEDIAQSVGSQLPTMLLAALEQINTQAGTA
jgi:hypothetical protein